MKRNLIIKRIFVVITVLFGIISCDFLENKTIHVPKSVIQEKTEKKFPVTPALPALGIE